MKRGYGRTMPVVGLVVVGLSSVSCRSTREIDDVETRIARELLLDESGKPREEVYAKNISFPKVRVSSGSEDSLRMDFIVRNAGQKKVVFLEVTIALLDKDGVQIAGRTDWFAHSSIFGENNTPILPQSSKRAGCEVQKGAQWEQGKIVVTIDRIRTE